LYEFGVRLYDPWAGVWLTREPLPARAWEPRTWHRYQYAYASPVSYYDPYGLWVPVEDGGGTRIAPPFPPPPTPTPPIPTGSQQECARAYLSPQREQLVKRYAALYGVPWQVLAGLLQSEIQLDTNWKDTVENLLLQTLYLESRLPIREADTAWLLLEMIFFLRPNPGPGVGNVHLETARKVSRYFAEQYGGQEELQLNLHNLPKEDLAFLLTLEEENIQVVAAYARMLADYRFGAERQPLLQSHADLSQWTLEDALALWHGYRYGVREVSPSAEKYGFELKDFQTRGTDLEGLIRLAQGRGKEESLLGAVPYFLCYFQRCD